MTDQVPRKEVWDIRILQDMYGNCKTSVRCAAGDTNDFHVKVGLHQGSALCPFLFTTIIDCMTGDVQREAPWDMLFANDVVLCGQTREEKKEG